MPRSDPRRRREEEQQKRERARKKKSRAQTLLRVQQIGTVVAQDLFERGDTPQERFRQRGTAQQERRHGHQQLLDSPFDSWAEVALEMAKKRKPLRPLSGVEDVLRDNPSLAKAVARETGKIV